MIDADNLVARIRSFAELGPDWNGYGEEPISPTAIETAAWFAERLTDNDDPHDAVHIFPVPCSDGRIMFEVERPDLPFHGPFGFIDVTVDGKFMVYFGHDDLDQIPPPPVDTPGGNAP